MSEADAVSLFNYEPLSDHILCFCDWPLLQATMKFRVIFVEMIIRQTEGLFMDPVSGCSALQEQS